MLRLANPVVALVSLRKKCKMCFPNSCTGMRVTCACILQDVERECLPCATFSKVLLKVVWFCRHDTFAVSATLSSATRFSLLYHREKIMYEYLKVPSQGFVSALGSRDSHRRGNTSPTPTPWFNQRDRYCKYFRSAADMSARHVSLLLPYYNSKLKAKLILIVVMRIASWQ